ncbi:efflux RND transporter permease subunit [Bacillus sp. N9]
MRNTVAICLIIILLIGGGLYSVSQMKMEKYPDIDIPFLHISIVYPGASPEQSMRDIGEKFEKNLPTSRESLAFILGEIRTTFTA